MSGFIAQEVQKILPDVVHIDQDSYTLRSGEVINNLLSLSTLDFIPHLVESIKELNTDFNKTKAELDYTKAELHCTNIDLINVKSKLERVMKQLGLE